MRTFKLIKEIPLSPSIGHIVTFETESDFNDGLYNVGAISCLLIDDCEDWPEFWEEVTEDITN